MGISSIVGAVGASLISKILSPKQKKQNTTPAPTEPAVKPPVPTQNIYSSSTLDQEDATLGRKKLLGT